MLKGSHTKHIKIIERLEEIKHQYYRETGRDLEDDSESRFSQDTRSF